MNVRKDSARTLESERTPRAPGRVGSVRVVPATPLRPDSLSANVPKGLPAREAELHSRLALIDATLAYREARAVHLRVLGDERARRDEQIRELKQRMDERRAA